MKRVINVERPSFPDVKPDQLMGPFGAARWQVMCGDTGHWRAGLYSPPEMDASEVLKLEFHDCPEFFWLVSGRLVLVISDKKGGTREIELKQGRPMLIESPHNGYCPDGPHTGQALVIERDEFSTEYRDIAKWNDETGG